MLFENQFSGFSENIIQTKHQRGITKGIKSNEKGTGQEQKQEKKNEILGIYLSCKYISFNVYKPNEINVSIIPIYTNRILNKHKNDIKCNFPKMPLGLFCPQF